MSELSPQSVSQLLVQWKAGDQEALQTLIPLIYKELHDLAHYYLRGERGGHTLQTTALVHEAYLRLAQQEPFHAENRAHFAAISAKLMRQVLVDYARSHRAAKRGEEFKVELAEDMDVARSQPADVVALNDCLNELEKIDPQQARIVELRFFGGLSMDETSALLGISPSTIGRDWNMAKAWLSREMRKGDHGKHRPAGKE
ncbi:MAG TPA: sigma-70 family RNA polymerase sigma factor [Candidatus Angelobacter sp.]